jgi:hypothetical protein
MAVSPLPGYQAFWTHKRKTLKSEFQQLTGKYPDADTQLRQLFRVLCDIEDVAGLAPAPVEESEQWEVLVIVNSAEENRVSYCRALTGKTLYSALYGTYTVTLKELKDLVKASIIAPEFNKAENTEENPKEEEGFQEVRRRKRQSSDETAKTAKKAAVQAKTSPTVKSQPKEVTTRNFFAPLRATEMENDPSTTEGSPRELLLKQADHPQ